MTTEKLYNIAQKCDVTVDRFDLPENLSVSASVNDKLFIGLDKAVSGRQEKVCLAHELGHCNTSGFYNVYSPLDIREKHERRANGWAIKRLIPERSLKSAVKSGLDSIFALAEYFDVTAEFMQKAIEYYNG